MKKIISKVLLAVFVIGLLASCSSQKSLRKCDGTRGQKTRMGTM